MMNESLSKEKANSLRIESELELNQSNLKKLNMVHTTKEESRKSGELGSILKKDKLDIGQVTSQNVKN